MMISSPNGRLAVWTDGICSRTTTEQIRRTPIRLYRTVMSYPAKILLIKLVRQHEELWNSRSPDYCRLDIKVRAWYEISARMAENGFESKVAKIKLMWKNLRDQWKRNLTVKMPAEREWFFQKRLNFLADTYEGRELAHCRFDPDASPDDIYEAPDDSLYSAKPDGYNDIENGFAIEGSSLMSDCSPAPSQEAKAEVQNNGRHTGPTLVTVLEEQAAQARIPRQSGSPLLIRVAPASTAPPAKRYRMEVQNEVGHMARQIPRESNNKNADKATPKTAKEIVSSLARPSDTTTKQTPVDKYDKYAAFVATTLRDMPELEAKKRMKEMTMLLLEEY